jgi:hypothetical protein
MDPFTASWAYYRLFLKHSVPRNPNIISIKEMDAAITIFTCMIKSAKDASNLCHAYPPRDSAIPHPEELLRRKRQARKNMHDFIRVAGRMQYSFLKIYIHLRLKHITIQRFEEDTEDASTTNYIWKITKRFTKQQTQCHAPVTHGRRGLTTHRWAKPHQSLRYTRTSFDQTPRSTISTISIDR